jgi:hypothetical protein
VNLVHRMQTKYSNGKLITEANWRELSELLQKVHKLERKDSYLKDNVILERYLDINVENFEELIQEHRDLLTICIDLSDYLDFRTNDSRDVFQDDQEALLCLQETLDKLIDSREVLEKYLNEEFE